LIEIINKQLLLQLVGYLCYWEMGFNSVFKGLNIVSIDKIQDFFFKSEKITDIYVDNTPYGTNRGVEETVDI